MPALEPFSAAGAMADLYIKLPQDLLAYDLLLILGFNLVLDSSATAGTTLGQGGYIPLIHGYRNRTAVVLAVGRPGLPAVTSSLRLPLAPGERSGLPLQSPPRLF